LKSGIETKGDSVDLGIKINTNILKQIKAISALRGKSMSNAINGILTEYLKRYKVELVEQNVEKERQANSLDINESRQYSIDLIYIK